MNVLVTAHLKQNYDAWKEVFDADSARAEFCDDSRTLVGKVDDSTALIALFDVDSDKMTKRLTSPEFSDLVKDFVIKHDAYSFEEMSIG